MLKREAEFSSHTIALLPAFREPHSARTWLGRCGGHTHAPLPSPPPSRAAELAARRAPFPSLGSSDVPVSRKVTFSLKKKKRTISSFNWPKLRPSDVSPVDSSIGFDYPVITHMAPNKELRFFFFFSFPPWLAYSSATADAATNRAENVSGPPPPGCRAAPAASPLSRGAPQPHPPAPKPGGRGVSAPAA